MCYSQDISNEEVLRRATTERNVIKVIWKRQLEFFGHAVRMDGMK